MAAGLAGRAWVRAVPYGETAACDPAVARRRYLFGEVLPSDIQHQSGRPFRPAAADRGPANFHQRDAQGCPEVEQNNK